MTAHVFDHTPTAQEVFDEACRFFATSPGPSTVTSSRTGTGHDCVYRAASGRTCIAGHFLPDSAYIPAMDEPDLYDDGTTVKALVRHYSDRVPAWWTTHVELLRVLQSMAHDDESNWKLGGLSWNRENVAYSLRFIADDHKLDQAAISLVLAERRVQS